MTKLRTIIGLWAALLLANGGTAVAAQDQSQHASLMQQEVIFSKILNEEREVTVKLPESYWTKPQQSYPVIYRLDGAANLALIESVIGRLHSANAAPEVIIVAIENTDRLRDLFPTANQDPRGPIGVGGGANKFLQFIETELMPLIDSKYRSHDYKIIAGGSAAGVFGLYAMQEKPGLFDAHMAYSPAVWWNTGAMAKRTKAFFTDSKVLDTYLYMDMGAEGGVMREMYEDMIAHLQANQPEGLTMRIDAFDGVPHGLTSAAGIFNAYHGLFLPMQMPAEAFTGDPDSITEYYQRLSHQRGEAVTPPEWVIRNLGYGLADAKHLDKANAIFEFNVSLHPTSPEALNGLAFGYEQAGEFNRALTQVNKAISLSKPDDDGYQVFTQRRDRLVAALNSGN